MKKRFGLIFVATVAAISLFVSSCATSKVATSVEREAGKTYELTFVHSNDTHGNTLATSEGVGGFAAVSTFVNKVRSENENVLVLHAGDINTGPAFSNMFNAEPDIKSINAIGYDAVTLGNHEFDGTFAKLKTQMALAEFPWLSANIKQGNKYIAKPYVIKDYEGFRVGVIGLTTLRTLVIANPDKSLKFINEIEAANEMVKVLREKEKADVVIVLGHLGDILETQDQTTSIKLAEQVSGIDLIIDGHAHSFFEEPKVVNGTPIVTANEYNKYAGCGVLSIKDGKVVDLKWQPVAINEKDFPPDENIAAMLKPYKEKADASLKEVVLKTTAEFEFGNKLTRYQEMPLGNFVTDSMVAYLEKTGVKVDGAITNGGGIRAALPKGDVTREDILTVLPFENYVYVLTLTGDDMIKLFDFVGSIKQGAGSFAQVSKEIKYTITYDANGNGKISNLTVGGKPIDKTKTYRIATNDYMAKGGDGYEVLTSSIDTYNTSMLISAVVTEYANSLSGDVTPVSDGRITIVGGTLP